MREGLTAFSDANVTAVTISVIAFFTVMLVIAGLRVRRDKNVRRTRWGVFIERDRYGEWPPLREEEPTRVKWPEAEQDEARDR